MRTIIKHQYIRSGPNALSRARAHVRYLLFRPGKDRDGDERRAFFDARNEDISHKQVIEALKAQKKKRVAVHKLILSPGEEVTDLQSYTREIMSKLGSNKGQTLKWFAVEHFHTDNPHVHIVVLGTDSHDRDVFLSLKDCGQARKFGDEHLHAHDLLGAKEKDPRPKESWLEKLLALVRSTFVKHKTKKQRAERLRHEEKRRSTVIDEARYLGEWIPPLPDKSARLDQTLKNRAWSKYSEPIEILYPGTDEPVTFTWQTPLRTLRALEREYISGRQEIQQHVTPKQFERLQQWIKHSWVENRRLQQDADSVLRIEVDFIDDTTVHYDRSSDVQSLLELYQLEKIGEIFLQDHEQRALEGWIVESIGVPKLSQYKSLGPKESLSYFCRAYQRGESWATEAIAKQDFEELRSLLSNEKPRTPASKKKANRIEPTKAPDHPRSRRKRDHKGR